MTDFIAQIIMFWQERTLIHCTKFCYFLFLAWVHSFHKKPTNVPAIFPVHHGRAALDIDKDLDEYLRQHLTLSSGMMMGLGALFCRQPAMPVMNVVVRQPCEELIVGCSFCEHALFSPIHSVHAFNGNYSLNFINILYQNTTGL